MPNPRRMDPREIVAEVEQISSDVARQLGRLFELSDTLYASVRHGHFRQERERLEMDLQLVQTRLERAVTRQEPPETRQALQNTVDGINLQLAAHHDIVPAYTMFANAYKRFAGTMNAGLRRTASVNRLVEQIQEKHGLTVQEARRPQPPPAAAGPDASVEDLVELYGEDTVNYATSE